jgi:hypothetical protein
MRIHVLHTPPFSGPDNMALDDALLDRARATGECVLRVYAWATPTLSFGRNQRARRRLRPGTARRAWDRRGAPADRRAGRAPPPGDHVQRDGAVRRARPGRHVVASRLRARQPPAARRPASARRRRAGGDAGRPRAAARRRAVLRDPDRWGARARHRDGPGEAGRERAVAGRWRPAAARLDPRRRRPVGGRRARGTAAARVPAAGGWDSGAGDAALGSSAARRGLDETAAALGGGRAGARRPRRAPARPRSGAARRARTARACATWTPVGRGGDDRARRSSPEDAHALTYGPSSPRRSSRSPGAAARTPETAPAARPAAP